MATEKPEPVIPVIIKELGGETLIIGTQTYYQPEGQNWWHWRNTMFPEDEGDIIDPQTSPEEFQAIEEQAKIARRNSGI